MAINAQPWFVENETFDYPFMVYNSGGIFLVSIYSIVTLHSFDETLYYPGKIILNRQEDNITACIQPDELDKHLGDWKKMNKGSSVTLKQQ